MKKKRSPMKRLKPTFYRIARIVPKPIRRPIANMLRGEPPTSEEIEARREARRVAKVQQNEQKEAEKQARKQVKEQARDAKKERRQEKTARGEEKRERRESEFTKDGEPAESEPGELPVAQASEAPPPAADTAASPVPGETEET